MEKIEELLNKIQSLSNECRLQREIKAQRGEYFNIFNDLGLMSDEVRLHSSFLSILLNPNGSHGQKDLFLKAFLQMLQESSHDTSIDLDTGSNDITVQVEKNIGTVTPDSGGRLDLYISDGKNQIIIENKIYATDQDNQMQRYWNYANNKRKGDNSFAIIYLTLMGDKPSKDSLSKLKKEDIICLSYKSDIKSWLKRCVELTSDKPLIQGTILQYIKTIDFLTNTNMESNNDILEFISEEKYLDAVFEIINSKDALVNHIMNDKFLPKLSKAVEEMGLKLHIDVKDKDWQNASYAKIIFENKDWKNFNLAIEFESTGLGNPIFGFLRKGNLQRSEISEWDKIRKNYTSLDRNNKDWISRKFDKHTQWATSQGLKDLYNTDTLNYIIQQIKDAKDCVEGLEL